MISNNQSSFAISGLNQQNSNEGSLKLPLDFSAPYGSLTIRTAFKARNFERISISVNFQKIDYIESNADAVDYKIILNGVDISAQITSNVQVIAKEGAARTATLSFFDHSAIIDPYALIDKQITIAYRYGGANVRLFTGKVHQPAFDHDTCIMTIICSDLLQETVEPLTEQDIKTAVGGLWDDNIFRAYKDGWTTVKERLSTIPSSYDLDPYRSPRVTQWKTKGTEDFLIDDGFTVYKTPKVSFAKRRNIINKVNLTFTASFNKKWQKDYQHSWQTGDTFDKWLSKPYGLPTKKAITDSLNGFVLKYISFTGLPEHPDTFIVDGTPFLWNPTVFSRALAFGCSFAVSRRWLQTMANEHKICIQAPESIAKHSELSVQDQKTYSIDNDQGWEDFKQYSVNRLGIAGDFESTASTEGVDYQNAIDTAIAIQNVRILSSHRQNTVSFQATLNPIFDLTHTVRVNLGKIDHKGKISKIEFNINKQKGSALMNVEASFYLPNVDDTEYSDALTIEAIPNPAVNIDNTVSAFPFRITESGLLNRVGDKTDLTQPDQDENWLGWVTNFAGHNRYNERWKVKIDGVEPEQRETKKVPSTHTINIPIPK